MRGLEQGRRLLRSCAVSSAFPRCSRTSAWSSVPDDIGNLSTEQMGKLLAYAGRDTGTREVVHKYPDTFRRELELYNLHRALASGRYDDDGLVIVPDFFDVIALFEAGITNAVALMDPEASDQQLGKLRELDNPSGLFTVVVAHPDQAAGEELACKLASIGYAHLTITSIDNALSEMSIEQFGRLFS